MNRLIGLLASPLRRSLDPAGPQRAIRGTAWAPHWITFGAAMLGCVSVPAQSPKPLPAEWIRETVQTRMTEHGIAAVSVGVVRDGKLVFTEGFGQVRKSEAAAPDESSMYQIASISKTFTGIVANRLILTGQLDPQQSITTYLQDVLEPAAIKRLKRVQVKHLLTHTSGIPNRHALIYTRVPRPRFAGYSEAQLIRDLNSVRLERTPGESCVYSNTGYTVLGYVCEQASGHSYRSLVQEFITTRFGLKDTTDQVRPDHVARLVASGFSRRTEQRPWLIDFGKGIPASGLLSNVADLSRLMIEQIDAFRRVEAGGDPDPLVLTGSHAEIEPGVRYGFGLFERNAAGVTTYSHSGSVDGFQSGYDFTPQRNVGLILLTSSTDGRAVHELKRELYAKLLDSPYEPGTRKRSLAQAVREEVQGTGVDAGIKLLQELRSADSCYLAEDEFSRVMLSLVEQGNATAAAKLYALHAELFPTTRQPLAVGLAVTTMDSGVDAARNQFADLIDSDQHVLREDELNQAGYGFLSNGNESAAIALFELNVTAFPGSPNVYDSLGDALRQSDNLRAARLQYETALALEPTSKTAAEALAELAPPIDSQSSTNEASTSLPPIAGSDLEGIQQTLTDYIEGSTNGQPERLKRAFHPDLNLYSIRDRRVSVWSGLDYIADTKPGEPTGEVGRILSIDYENDAAVAKVRVSPPGQAPAFVDYFMLLKVNGRWRIIHKMFTRRTR